MSLVFQHFNNMQYLYGNANVRLPNELFRILSSTIKSKNDKTNVQQVAFSYIYLVTVSFLYKYAHFVDDRNMSYIQNSDIKELLGYNKTTKSIDRIIKNQGVLDKLGLTETIKDYPISFEINDNETINDIKIREYATIGNLLKNESEYLALKKIVKNRNYTVKEPLFLTTGNPEREFGTLYSIERTHQITIEEFIKFVFDEELDNIDMMLYGFFKAKCKGHKNNMWSSALYKICMEIGIDRSTFYKHLNVLKERGCIDVNHKGWQREGKMESNNYYWLGI